MRGAVVKEYDIIFITNIPAFYKTNVYEAVGHQCRVFVVFLANKSECRSVDFYKIPTSLDCMILNECSVERRNILSSSLALFKVLKTVRAKLLVVGGWDAPEYWLSLYLARVQKRAIALESSCFESKPTGLKGFFKRLFVQKLDLAFPSGKAHAALLKQLHFKGPVIYTKGVGIFSIKAVKLKKRLPFRGKWLYVGRLAEEKNLSLLIQVMNQLPHLSLTIVGAGPLEKQLRQEAGSTIHFLGHIPNEQLGAVYQAHDVFVLPSNREPWGLVVEEAIHYGLPVVVSSQVGCAEEWILEHPLGLMFESNNAENLKKTMETMSDLKVFSSFQKNVQAFDFKKRDQEQIDCYVGALDII